MNEQWASTVTALELGTELSSGSGRDQRVTSRKGNWGQFPVKNKTYFHGGAPWRQESLVGELSWHCNISVTSPSLLCWSTGDPVSPLSDRDAGLTYLLQPCPLSVVWTGEIQELFRCEGMTQEPPLHQCPSNPPAEAEPLR